jgi:N-formylglutamate amidohydrolase
MAARFPPPGDSQHHAGGEIPGSGLAAFTLRHGPVSTLPVLIAVPHAGRAYPSGIIERMRHPAYSSLRLEDRYADRLAEAVADATGASLLVADAPRAMIDLNRSVDDVDWEMFGGIPADVGSYTPGRRVRSGLGLIPRRLPGLGELWNRRHDRAELAQRIAGIHEPYHTCLGAALDELRVRWGAALLVDLHSMPPLPASGGRPSAQFVIGDRFGASCHGALVAAGFACLARAGRNAAHNRPYAGGYVLERHAAPRRGIYAMQVEVDRSVYLDSRLIEPGPGFAETVALLVGLVRHLAQEVSALGVPAGGHWATAAE